MKPSARAIQVAGALVTVWLVWGSTFLGIRVVVLSAPPLLSAGARFVLAGLLLLAGVACWRRWSGGRSVREDLAGRLGRLSMLGMLHFLVANGLVSIASQDLPSSTAAVLYSTVPLWLLIVAAAADRRHPSIADLCRTGVGLLGVAVVLGLRTATVLPSLLVLLAAVSWAGATLLAARAPGDATGLRRAGPALESSVQMLVGGLGLLVAAGATGELGPFDPGVVTPQAWIAEAYLILFGSLAGFFAYTWMVSTRVDTRLLGTFAYVNPVVAVVLGAVVLDEHVGLHTLLGTALVATSVALTALATPARPRPGPIPAADPTAADPSPLLAASGPPPRSTR